MRPNAPRDAIKRATDLALVIPAIVVLAVPVIAIAIAVRVRLDAPILFSQLRPGRDAKPFRMFKFRTMTNAVSAQGVLLPDKERLTPFGMWLRRTSLDELPELWNILRGDMSLVGPRPLLIEYLAHYTDEQHRRHDVRPGLTGWAQVNGRNALSWKDKFRLDVWYVDHRSFWLDMQILWQTIVKVIKRDGITAEGEATMPRFEKRDR